MYVHVHVPYYKYPSLLILTLVRDDFFVTNSPGNLPGFLATIIGFEECIDIAVPKIKPLASIEIIASASFIILLFAISKVNLI